MIKENLKAHISNNNSNSETILGLNTLLSNYQIYYQNLRALHWLIEGKQFFVLHEKYEEWYTEAAENIDEVAERILMIGGKPTHTLEDYLVDSEIKPIKNIYGAEEGIQVVYDNNKYLLEHFKKVLKEAEKADDEGTVDMMSGLIKNTEKRIWMLKSFLG
ncbi:MAG: DNA starvation/stationary phase protection protein [Bacteroidetes bacterium]|nr:DNA starvation/stationary phase protection protein [Bacteroidota bacterium]